VYLCVRLSTVIIDAIRVCDIRIRRNQLQTIFVFLEFGDREKFRRLGSFLVNNRSSHHFHIEKY
jgi:hypothetical protein